MNALSIKLTKLAEKDILDIYRTMHRQEASEAKEFIDEFTQQIFALASQSCFSTEIRDKKLRMISVMDKHVYFINDGSDYSIIRVLKTIYST
jgi:plasmid stabilization system protein ParE